MCMYDSEGGPIKKQVFKREKSKKKLKHLNQSDQTVCEKLRLLIILNTV